ncbi:hypothetical protein [Streptomyces sp. NPDC050355]|uniref:hypothetical protein n=1 Tax=Streptomyces sp. NPDC050355 TaxID=3365609 RepID=UPI0037ADE43F
MSKPANNANSRPRCRARNAPFALPLLPLERVLRLKELLFPLVGKPRLPDIEYQREEHIHATGCGIGDI